MVNKANEIILFENQNVKLEVNLKDENVWLTQAQMAELFGRDQSVITRHVRNIFVENELEEKSNMQKMHFPNSDKMIAIYSLDVIISVGYRVKSQNGVIFRRWANKILKDYILKGYAINQKRLEYLEKTVKLIDIANRMDDRLEDSDAKEILKVIGEYSKALDLLDAYDYNTVTKVKGKIDERRIKYEDCLEIIKELRFNSESKLFALERDNGLESIINNIYQCFDNKELYESIQEI